jgi:hypothetical protein
MFGADGPGLVQFDQVLGWWRIRYSPPLGQIQAKQVVEEERWYTKRQPITAWTLKLDDVKY